MNMKIWCRRLLDRLW